MKRGLTLGKYAPLHKGLVVFRCDERPAAPER